MGLKEEKIIHKNGSKVTVQPASNIAYEIVRFVKLSNRYFLGLVDDKGWIMFMIKSIFPIGAQ